MNNDIYRDCCRQILEHAFAIETAKRPAYTIGSADVLANFKRAAERTGCSAEQVWAVHFLKHVDAIISGMTRPDLPQAEPLIGRFADGMNYLKLGWALYTEGDASSAVDEQADAERAHTSCA